MGAVIEAMAMFSVGRSLKGNISQPTKLTAIPAAVRYDQALTVISEQLSVESELLLVNCKLFTVDGISTIVGANKIAVFSSKWRSPESLSGIF